MCLYQRPDIAMQPQILCCHVAFTVNSETAAAPNSDVAVGLQVSAQQLRDTPCYQCQENARHAREAMEHGECSPPIGLVHPYWWRLCTMGAEPMSVDVNCNLCRLQPHTQNSAASPLIETSCEYGICSVYICARLLGSRQHAHHSQ